ncbi:MAG: ERF family protein [Ruminococcus flavefaciens]|nr:ERF family protein [Ruminococcus flavefaciens]
MGALKQEELENEYGTKPQAIFAAIHGIMEEIGAIGKDKRNTQQNFNYRGVDDVMNALSPALIHNNVFVVPEVLEQHREERQTKSGGNLIYSIIKVKYTFYSSVDGSSISATVIGEGMDSSDKGSNKAMSVAFKYACFQVFCIPTEEMVDPDSEALPPSKPTVYHCECCGKEITANTYNGTKAKCGYGVCSAECRDKLLGGAK